MGLKKHDHFIHSAKSCFGPNGNWQFICINSYNIIAIAYSCFLIFTAYKKFVKWRFGRKKKIKTQAKTATNCGSKQSVQTKSTVLTLTLIFSIIVTKKIGLYKQRLYEKAVCFLISLKGFVGIHFCYYYIKTSTTHLTF